MDVFAVAEPEQEGFQEWPGVVGVEIRFEGVRLEVAHLADLRHHLLFQQVKAPWMGFGHRLAFVRLGPFRDRAVFLERLLQARQHAGQQVVASQ